MPITCEVCGSMDDSAEYAGMDDYLHICDGCIKDRRQPDEPVVGTTEDAAD